ncbi:hypothetical protein F53441_3146 [Fusarium austroafricanum]|uniref:rRNA methyltransferase 1, mitochondrial n=1 Tax=Fusarium austroafricanum TaxID=2364996 RepID=A0A8H4KN28_9HYPO|nr:hypothetical protein F53441_3146 [Fusarium austroafricanum]
MLCPTQLRVAALSPPLARLHPSQTSFAPIFVRAKGLSAIIQGVIKSDQAQHGSTDFRSRRFNNGDIPRYRSGRVTSGKEPPPRRDEFLEKFSARATDPGSRTSGTRNWRQEQKLRKKLRKKEEEKRAQEEREENGTGRRTRRRRFADPENEFGNGSLVQRMKYGDLKEVAESLKIQQPIRPRSFREARRERAVEFRDRNNDTPRDERPRPSNERFEQLKQQFSRSERRFDRLERRSKTSHQRYERSNRQFDRADRGPNEQFDGPQRRFDRSGQDDSRQDNARVERWNDQGDDSMDVKRGKRKEMMAMTLKYTTAASQFLYGRSVVKAVLDQNRRKLYNLYIHGGENRMDNRDSTTLMRMAQKLGVPITVVPPEEQRIMDKMSMGRPHNGFVLEASPLPQLPIKSLGKLEESPGRLGFHVDLDYQTKEEAAINGTDTFIRRSNDVMPKPFVVLLNEIVDPGNVGGIIRTASYLGIDAVGITNRGSSTLTPVVLKSAAGAVEEISLFTVDDPLRFIQESGKAGWKTYAAVAPPDRKLVRKHGDKFISTDSIEAQSPLNEHPCLLILGNEGHGLSKPLKVAADYELSVPRFVQGSCVDSLNVSVAAGLLCHSFVKEPVISKTKLAETMIESTEAEIEAKPVEGQDKMVSDSEPIEKSEVNLTAKPEEKKSEEDKAKENDNSMF